MVGIVKSIDVRKLFFRMKLLLQLKILYLNTSKSTLYRWLKEGLILVKRTYKSKLSDITQTLINFVSQHT